MGKATILGGTVLGFFMGGPMGAMFGALGGFAAGKVADAVLETPPQKIEPPALEGPPPPQ